MKEILLMKEEKKVLLRDVSEETPIFAKKNGRLAGMIVHEDRGWILRIGGQYGSDSWHQTRRRCMETNLEYGYTFYVEG